MKICIFGADGRTGIEIVELAKSKGLEITAFVYSGSSPAFSHKGIKIIQGDVLDYPQVLQACRGVDAVISALGHIKGSDPRMQTKGTSNIVTAMKENNVQRVISLTGTGARCSWDTPSYIDIILNFIVKIVDKDRIEDGIGHVKVLQNSGLDWTIIRVLKLSSGKNRGENYTLTTGGPVELVTSRKKVARIMVDMLKDTKYSGALPVVSA